MWLICSSIGKKLIMSITGISLILFLTFHMLMNLVVLISPEAYNAICAFLGANWYALIATKGLAALVAVHILYALLLTFQNRKARGNDAYAVNARPKEVAWASQNMLVLGIIIVVFLVLHLYHFWSKMQMVEIAHYVLGFDMGEAMAITANGVPLAADGAYWIARTFANPINVVLYLIGFAALWFHLTHGFWSALQTIGINNQIWFNRWRCVGNIWATAVMLGYAVIVIVFFLKSIFCGTACVL